MATAVKAHDLVIAQVFYQLKGLGVLTEEVFASVGAAVVLKVLQLAVADLVHASLQ